MESKKKKNLKPKFETYTRLNDVNSEVVHGPRFLKHEMPFTRSLDPNVLAVGPSVHSMLTLAGKLMSRSLHTPFSHYVCSVKINVKGPIDQFSFLPTFVGEIYVTLPDVRRRVHKLRFPLNTAEKLASRSLY